MSEAELPPTIIYEDVILWEAPIQVAVSDVVRPGDTVLDIGANVGGLSVAFSRMVGGAGRVFAFECNPRMIAWVKRDLAANNVDNVTLIERAAWKSSGERLSLHLHDSYYGSASSLKWNWRQGDALVETVSVDQVCVEHALAPRLIKLDVEGAEDEVLAGAAKTIELHRPVIVTECHPRGGPDQILRLSSWGYDLFDVNSYERVSAADMHSEIPTNAICFPREWRVSFQRETMGVFPADSVHVLAGRMLVSADLKCSGEGVGQLKFLAGDELLAMAQTPLTRLAHYSNSTAAFSFHAPTELCVTLERLSGDGVCELGQVTVQHVERITV